MNSTGGKQLGRQEAWINERRSGEILTQKILDSNLINRSEQMCLLPARFRIFLTRLVAGITADNMDI